ncbi:MAG: hypothetical protein R3E66_18860 [bacterium]
MALVCIAALGAIACGDEQAAKDSEKTLGLGSGESGRARTGDLTRKGFVVEELDLNADKKSDQWVIKDAATIVRYERDMNFDGKVDVWQYPDASGAIIEEEMDFDYDGRVDLVVFYEAGIAVKKFMSVDFAGILTIAKYYDNAGELLRVERDEDANGTADIFEYYEKKRRVRIGWDENGDGAPDRFDTLD